MRKIHWLVFLLGAASLAVAQPDSKTLLRDAAARYRNAKSFEIEWDTKITGDSPSGGGWSKQTFKVAASGNKYHWESTGGGLPGMRINDGTSDWFYRPGLHRYYVQPSDPTQAHSHAAGSAGGSTEGWIRSSMDSLLRLDDDADASVLEPDENVEIGGKALPCHVVRATRTLSYREGSTTNREDTYWVDKATGLVRKTVLFTTGPTSFEADDEGQKRTVEIVYTRVSLDSEPDAKLFAFTPPANAFLVDDARLAPHPTVRAGSAAPPLKLKDGGGTLVDLADFKGKLVAVQFWASWCGACHEEMKELASLAAQQKDLVVISVDEDEIPERGDQYFSAQKFAWKNLHDPGEVARKAWGLAGFPLLVLVNGDGKVAWTDTGFTRGSIETLREHLGGEAGNSKGNQGR